MAPNFNHGRARAAQARGRAEVTDLSAPAPGWRAAAPGWRVAAPGPAGGPNFLACF